MEQRKKSKIAKASLSKIPTPQREESEEEEEEVATHLGGNLGDPLTGHFSMANLSSDEDN